MRRAYAAGAVWCSVGHLTTRTTLSLVPYYYLFSPIIYNSSTTLIPSEAATPLVLTLTTLCYRTS